MQRQRTTIEAVLCRLEARELEEAAEDYQELHNDLLEGLEMSLDMNNGQKARKGKPIVTLRTYGLLVTRVGLATLAASEDEEQEDDDEDS